MKDNILHRRDRLIITTIEIIDELGIQGLSTREIAKRQGVSEATLFRHYRSKNELLLAVLDYYTQFDQDICDTVKMKDLKPLEAVRYLVDTSFEYYENYPAITAIMHLFDVLRYDPDLKSKVLNLFENRTRIISDFIEEAQKNGEISVNLDSEIIASMISGTCREICLQWRINHMDFPLRDRVLKAIDAILLAYTS